MTTTHAPLDEPVVDQLAEGHRAHSAPQSDRRESARLARLLERAPEILSGLMPIATPPPVTAETLDQAGRPGGERKLTAEAIELARQVYYEQYGTMAEAARAIIAAGLTDDAGPVVVADRLRTFWKSAGWQTRPRRDILALRDLQQGGLYRSERRCAHVADGTSRIPAGSRCEHSALADGDHCAGHDPRPEYIARRAKRGAAAARGRRADLVDVEPLTAWLQQQRKRLLAEARQLHPNQKGHGLVADLIGADPAIAGRLLRGLNPGQRGDPGRIRAKTVCKYLDHAGVSFTDVYGFEPPLTRAITCPQCAGPMNAGSNLCATCHQASQGDHCTHQFRSGRRCTVRTRRPSGLCTLHERQHEAQERRAREPRTRRPYQGLLSDDMLLLALDEYARFDSLQWVAHRLWDTDAHGIRRCFPSAEHVAHVLSQRANREGFRESPDVLLRTLTERLGPPVWPDQDRPVAPSATKLVPFDPLLSPLGVAKSRRGALAQACARARMGSDAMAALLRRPPKTIGRDRADRILTALDYPGAYAAAYVAWRMGEGR